MFEHESYSFSVSETAPANQLIGIITAKDFDFGRFGTHGIRYSLSGAGSELFHVNDNGAITVAECSSHKIENHREKRQTMKMTNAKKVNLTIVGETGFVDVDDSSTESFIPYTNVDEVTFRPYFSVNDDYMVMSDDSNEETTTISHQTEIIDINHSNDFNAIDEHLQQTKLIKPSIESSGNEGAGHSPCLDYETQSVYFLTYKVNCMKWMAT